MNEHQTSPGAFNQSKHSRTPTLFFGEHGLRAGWGCFLFLVLLLAVGTAERIATELVANSRAFAHTSLNPGRWPVMLMLESLSASAVLFVTWLVARIEHRRFLSFGLGAGSATPKGLLKMIGGGLLSGFAAISALVALLWSMHLLTFSGPAIHGAALWGYGFGWAIVFCVVALFEETLLRGYLLFTLGRGIGFGWSALVLSIAFGAIHGTNKGETPVGLFAAAAVGLLFCLSVWYTRSLWWAISFHAAWDWGESFFWSTSDSGMVVQGHLLHEQPQGSLLLSGGATGPEGSLLVFPILLVCTLAMVLWWRGKGGIEGTAAAGTS